LTAVCQDDFGRVILRQTAQAGVVIDHVLISCEQPSAAYMALTGADGQLLVGIDATESVRQITVDYLLDHAELLADARFVMLDANVALDAAETLLRICAEAGVPVGLDPVAQAPALRYRPLIGAFALVAPNAVEAQALTGLPVTTVEQARKAARRLIGTGCEMAIVTLADEGLVYATSETSGHVPAVRTEIVDATGGSDALTATVIYARLHGIPTDDAVRLGVSAAALTIAAPDTVRQDLTLESLYAQLVL
jgi:pseudouridine kinase